MRQEDLQVSEGGDFGGIHPLQRRWSQTAMGLTLFAIRSWVTLGKLQVFSYLKGSVVFLIC